MPPKKKKEGGRGKSKGGSKKGTSKGPALLDGLPVKSMTKEQLEGHVLRLKKEVDKEREERSFIEREVERLQRLWSVANDTLNLAKSDLRLKDAEMSRNEQEILEETRKIKCENTAIIEQCESRVGKLQLSNLESIKNNHETFIKEKQDLEIQMVRLQNDIRKERADNLSQIATLKLGQSRELENLRQALEIEWKEIEKENDVKMQRLYDELELKRKSELATLQQKKNENLSRMIVNHEREMEKVRKESSDVTSSNLRLIKQLKSELNEKNKILLQSQQKKNRENSENKELTQEISIMKKQVADAKKKLEWCKSLEINNKAMDKNLKFYKNENENLKLDLELFRKKLLTIEKERNELHSNLSKVVAEVNQKSQIKTLILEKKLAQLSSELEKKEGVVSEVIRVTNLDSTTYGTISDKFEKIIDEKNVTIRKLREEIGSLRRMYSETLQNRTIDDYVKK